MNNTLKYAFRITHIDNMSHIVKYGLVKSASQNRNEHFISIGDPRIIEKRKEHGTQGYDISDYIPFYLGPRSPMLYVIQHGYNGVPRCEPEKIVYCVIKIDDLVCNDIDCIFTDGHALSVLTSFYAKDKLSQINNIINFNDVYSHKWNSATDIDLKRRKEAELLVKNDLPISLICGYIVYNDVAKNALLGLGVDEKKIAVSPNYYF